MTSLEIAYDKATCFAETSVQPLFFVNFMKHSDEKWDVMTYTTNKADNPVDLHWTRCSEINTIREITHRRKNIRTWAVEIIGKHNIAPNWVGALLIKEAIAEADAHIGFMQSNVQSLKMNMERLEAAAYEDWKKEQSDGNTSQQ